MYILIYAYDVICYVFLIHAVQNSDNQVFSR